MIITLSGEEESGKETTAKILSNTYGFKTHHYLDNIRDMCTSVFGLSRKKDHDESNSWANLPHPVQLNPQHIDDIILWIKKINKRALSHEQVLDLRAHGRDGIVFESYDGLTDFLDKELIADCFDPFLNIEVVIEKILKEETGDHVVILSDLCTVHLEMLKMSLGALHVLVECPQIKPVQRFKDKKDWAHILNNDRNKLLGTYSPQIEAMLKKLK